MGATKRELKAAFAVLMAAAIMLLAGAAGASAFAPGPEWAVSVGETDADADEIDGVSIDPDSNTVISGVFRGEVVLGDKTFQSVGEGDIFLASLAPDGDVRWARQFGGTGDENTFDLKTDGAGNIVASGWYTGSVDFGGSTLQSLGATDMFVAKYDQDGNLIWANSYGGASGDGGNELDVLPNGEIAVAGITEGNFKAGAQNFSYGGGGRDSYAIRLDRNGIIKWVRAFNGPGLERIRAMDLNSSGEVSAGFQYRGTVSLGGTTVSSYGDWDGAIARLTSEGDPVWLLPVGGAGVDNVRGIGSGPDGSIYASGVYEGTVNLVDRQIPSIGNQGDDFLARISSSGVPEWIVTVGGAGPGTGAEIRSDVHGVIASSVASRDITVYRNGQATETLRPPGGVATSYLAAFAPDGSLRFTYLPQAVGAQSGTLGDILAIAPDGLHVAQVLRFKGTLQVGGTTLTTPSEKDSAVAFLRTDVPEPTVTKARPSLVIRRITPKKVLVRRGRSKLVKVEVFNRGETAATNVKVCPKLKATARRKIRLSGCVIPGRIAAASSKRVKLRVTARRTPASRAHFRIRVTSRNATERSTRVSVRIRRVERQERQGFDAFLRTGDRKETLRARPSARRSPSR